MTIERKTIIERALCTFVAACMEAGRDGWEIDPDSVPDVWGFSYQTGLIKDTEKARKRAEDFLAGVPPKKDRAQILADARAAKVAKRVKD